MNPIQFSSPSLPPAFVGAGFILYLVAYWGTLLYILSKKSYSTQERILWFLVITLATVIGLLTYWFLGLMQLFDSRDDENKLSTNNSSPDGPDLKKGKDCPRCGNWIPPDTTQCSNCHSSFKDA